ncbi:MAG: tripartite tricarboxylate transporter substrate binding protein [Acetobacteraceae bacterium]|nr:tripartite tricarboxylate transporter substrate binding protein [Acetobacteraceae bacterium]
MIAIRRRSALLGASALFMGAPALGQNFPLRQVRVIVGFAPGGANDIMARLVAGKLNERLPGTSFIVENRPGAATLVAADQVARAAPDGMTLMYTSNSTIISPLVNRGSTFDPMRDFAPIVLAQEAPMLLLVRPDSSIRTVAQMIEAARRAPGRLTVSHPGTGAINHLTMTLFQRETGTEFTLVPYTGNAPALTALVRGDVDFAHDSTLSARSFVDSGQLRPIAVSSAQRLSIMPDVPTFAETVPGHALMFWGGLFAPRATPAPLLDRIHAEVNEVLRQPDVIARVHQLGAEPGQISRAAFAQMVTEEWERWSTVVRAAGIRAE